MSVNRLEGWVHYGYENSSWPGVGSNRAKDKTIHYCMHYVGILHHITIESIVIFFFVILRSPLVWPW